MKVTFSISGKFPFSEETTKAIFRFCLHHAKRNNKSERQLPNRMTVKCEQPYWTRSGRATLNCGRTFHARVLIRVNSATVRESYLEKYPRYKHREDCPSLQINSGIERLIHLIAHELGHAIIGFKGDMCGEYQCERFAARTVQAWRERECESPACLI